MNHEGLEDIMLHLFGVINKYELRARLGENHKAIWEGVISDGYLLKNCKLYLWAYTMNKMAGLPTSPASFGVSRQDAAKLRKIDLSSLGTFKAYSIQEFDRLEIAIFVSSSLELYIKKFAIKKLRFLVSNGTYSLDCIRSNLMAHAILALRKQYPRFESELHALNACKTAIHNAGMGMIEYGTRGKRSVLIRNADSTFSNINSSLTVMEPTVRGVDLSEERDLKISLNQLAERMKPRARSFFNALRGCPDADFAEFAKTETENLDLLRKKARRFYGVTEEQEKHLFNQIKEHL